MENADDKIPLSDLGETESYLSREQGQPGGAARLKIRKHLGNKLGISHLFRKDTTALVEKLELAKRQERGDHEGD